MSVALWLLTAADLKMMTRLCQMKNLFPICHRERLAPAKEHR